MAQRAAGKQVVDAASHVGGGTYVQMQQVAVQQVAADALDRKVLHRDVKSTSATAASSGTGRQHNTSTRLPVALGLLYRAVKAKG